MINGVGAARSALRAAWGWREPNAAGGAGGKGSWPAVGTAQGGTHQSCAPARATSGCRRHPRKGRTHRRSSSRERPARTTSTPPDLPGGDQLGRRAAGAGGLAPATDGGVSRQESSSSPTTYREVPRQNCAGPSGRAPPAPLHRPSRRRPGHRRICDLAANPSRPTADPTAPRSDSRTEHPADQTPHLAPPGTHPRTDNRPVHQATHRRTGRVRSGRLGTVRTEHHSNACSNYLSRPDPGRGVKRSHARRADAPTTAPAWAPRPTRAPTMAGSRPVFARAPRGRRGEHAPGRSRRAGEVRVLPSEVRTAAAAGAALGVPTGADSEQPRLCRGRGAAADPDQRRPPGRRAEGGRVPRGAPGGTGLPESSGSTPVR